jgi:hypothetical protein
MEMYYSELKMLALDIAIVTILVMFDGVWIGNCIYYCALKQLVTILCKSLSYTDWRPAPRSLRCLVTPPTHTRINSALTADWPLLYILSKECTENTASNRSSIVVWVSVEAIT